MSHSRAFRIAERDSCIPDASILTTCTSSKAYGNSLAIISTNRQPRDPTRGSTEKKQERDSLDFPSV